MKNKTDTTINIDFILDTGVTQIVRCTAPSGDEFLTDRFDCFCSRTNDAVVVVPAAGPHHGPMKNIQGVEELIVLRAGVCDEDWARAAAVAAVCIYLRYSTGRAKWWAGLLADA